MFDKDGSGLVSTQELKIALSKGEDEDFMSTVNEFDSNGDGEISESAVPTLLSGCWLHNKVLTFGTHLNRVLVEFLGFCHIFLLKIDLLLNRRLKRALFVDRSNI